MELSKSGALGSIPGLATYFCFSFRFFKKGSCQLLAKMYVHEVLVNRLGGLSRPRKSVVRLTDRPDMTLDVYRGRKTTIQQHKWSYLLLKCSTGQKVVTEDHFTHWAQINVNVFKKTIASVPYITSYSSKAQPAQSGPIR